MAFRQGVNRCLFPEDPTHCHVEKGFKRERLEAGRPTREMGGEERKREKEQ